MSVILLDAIASLDSVMSVGKIVINVNFLVKSRVKRVSHFFVSPVMM